MACVSRISETPPDRLFQPENRFQPPGQPAASQSQDPTHAETSHWHPARAGLRPFIAAHAAQHRPGQLAIADRHRIHPGHHRPAPGQRAADLHWYRLIHSAVRRTTAIAKSTDPSLATFFADEQKQSAADTSAIQKQVEGLMVSAEEKRLFAEISDLRKGYVAARDDVIRLKRDGQAAEADKLLESAFLPTASRYVERVKALLEMQRKALDQAAAPIREANDRARHLMWLLGSLCLGVGVACSVLITRSITQPVARSLKVAQQVASGDLSPLPQHPLASNDSRDETSHLLQALGTMQASLTRVILGIR